MFFFFFKSACKSDVECWQLFFPSLRIMAEITLKGWSSYHFYYHTCVLMKVTVTSWQDLETGTIFFMFNPAARTWAEVTVNNGNWASWPTLIKAHSGTSGSEKGEGVHQLSVARWSLLFRSFFMKFDLSLCLSPLISVNDLSFSPFLLHFLPYIPYLLLLLCLLDTSPLDIFFSSSFYLCLPYLLLCSFQQIIIFSWLSHLPSLFLFLVIPLSFIFFPSFFNG